MCLILFAWRSHPQHKLLLAANRDEFYSRPTAAAHFWEEAPHILAGRDLEQGGTWLGVTRNGRFAAITNVRDPLAAKGAISRGQLVHDFLDSNLTPREFLQTLQSSLQQYSPFNLLLSDGEHMHYGNSLGEQRELHPGVYGLSNAALDTPWPKVLHGKQKLFEVMTHEPEPAHLFDLLSERQQAEDNALPDTGIDRALEKQLSARFIHMHDYGTRCSTVVAYSHDGTILFLEKQFGEDGMDSHNFVTSFSVDLSLPIKNRAITP